MRRCSSVSVELVIVKVAGFMSILGITSLCSYKKTLGPNANFLTDTSCIERRLVKVSVSQRYIPEKKRKTNKKTNGHGTACISKSGCG